MTRTTGELPERRARADSLLDRGARAALVVFVLVEAGAFLMVLRLARFQWFFLDEWDYLASRTAGSLGDLFRPHHEHWSTLPILAYRLLWWMFGLRTYRPYLALVVTLHLTIAVLLRVVMRRAGVAPWLATAAAALFVLFGSGRENIAWAIDIGFDTAVVLGLTQLLLADHDGAIQRRDWLGLVAGVGGLMCSGTAVTMVVVVGVATMLRRGWRVALFHVAPLAAIYVTWYAVIGHRRDQPNYGGGLIQDVKFVYVGIEGAFGALGQVSGAGLALAFVLVVGLVLAASALGRTEWRRSLAAPVALLVGAVVALGFSATGRSAFGPAYARQSRYLHVVAAMLLPGIAVAATFLTRRWRLLGPALLALFVVGIPGNVHTLASFEHNQEAFQRQYRRMMSSIPAVPLARRVDPATIPEHKLAGNVTIGWLVAGAASGRIPPPRPFTRADQLTGVLRLSLVQDAAPQSNQCQTITRPVLRTWRPGRRIGIRGGLLQVTFISDKGGRSHPTSYDPNAFLGNTLIVTHGPLTLQIRPNDAHQPVALCAAYGYLNPPR